MQIEERSPQIRQIVPGLEPTGHYWFCFATWMVSNVCNLLDYSYFRKKICLKLLPTKAYNMVS